MDTVQVETLATSVPVRGSRYAASHRATRYRVTSFRVEPDALGLRPGSTFLLVDPYGDDRGTWVRIPDTQGDIAWSTLADRLGLREGDREGYEALFATAGITVF